MPCRAGLSSAFGWAQEQSRSSEPRTGSQSLNRAKVNDAGRQTLLTPYQAVYHFLMAKALCQAPMTPSGSLRGPQALKRRAALSSTALSMVFSWFLPCSEGAQVVSRNFLNPERSKHDDTSGIVLVLVSPKQPFLKSARDLIWSLHVACQSR